MFCLSVVFLSAFLVGVDSKEVPPVPIPNTEVKLFSAYNTWLVTTWEDWTMPTPSFLQGSSSFGSCLVFVWIENFLKADLFRLFSIVIRNLDFFSKKLDFFGEVVYNIGITLLRKELDYEINTYKNCCAFIGSCDGDYSWRLQ